jgi:hypothetical protein
MRFVFSVFINWQCNVEHNDDAIRKILHLYFVVLLIIPHLGNKILHIKISSKRQRCRDERLSVDVEYRSNFRIGTVSHPF